MTKDEAKIVVDQIRELLPKLYDVGRFIQDSKGTATFSRTMANWGATDATTGLTELLEHLERLV